MSVSSRDFLRLFESSPEKRKPNLQIRSQQCLNCSSYSQRVRRAAPALTISVTARNFLEELADTALQAAADVSQWGEIDDPRLYYALDRTREAIHSIDRNRTYLFLHRHRHNQPISLQHLFWVDNVLQIWSDVVRAQASERELRTRLPNEIVDLTIRHAFGTHCVAHRRGELDSRLARWSKGEHRLRKQRPYARKKDTSKAAIH